ncbi:MAG TPA: PmoA family protein [Caulifigura sp.]|nr:PmoA family protein [Caulifigura sp.]
MPGITRCDVLPLPGDRFSFRVDGREVTAWNFAADLKRPFLFPVNGPVSGESLSRLGHPGAPNHDHHDSVWFAHNKVLGVDFWGNTSPASIRQTQWLAMEDNDQFARAAVRLAWSDGHDAQPLLEQDLIIEVRPLVSGDYTVELTAQFTPRAEVLEFQQTNFGFFAVRVARSISAVFGEGRLTSSSGATGEKNLFDKTAEWMDDSGPMPKTLADGSRAAVMEGITLFDHRTNPRFPSSWHVRDDGWMGPSVCHSAPLVVRRSQPLMLRYLLHPHSGPVDQEKATTVQTEWHSRPLLTVRKSTKPHHQFEITPAS